MAYKFSPSSLSILKECPRCFWLHFNKGARRPSGIFPSLPSGMDKALKQHFAAYAERGQLPPALRELDDNTTIFNDGQTLRLWQNNFHGIQYHDPDGNLFRGAIDNVLVKDGRLIVLDYKTRGYALKEDTADHYQDQIDIYTCLLRKNGYETEDYAYLLFYYPDKITSEGDVLFHTRLVKIDVDPQRAEDIFSRALAVLEGNIPPPAHKCAYCKWADSLKELS